MHISDFFPAISAFFASAVVTFGIIKISKARGVVKEGSDERWHSGAVPFMGGLGIFFSFALVGILSGAFTDIVHQTIFVGTTAMFLLGFVDDLFELKPHIKLILQIIIAVFVANLGIRISFIQEPILAIGFSVLWLLALTNAFNLIDNMDGLSAGIGSISLTFFICLSLLQGDTSWVNFAAILACSILGFLVFNFPPAKIFMGDSGALMIGFLLGCLGIVGTWHQASNMLLLLATPLLLVAVPIFDTALVSLQRILHGRPVYQGGKDHTSHRLIAFGLSEKHTLFVFYSISFLMGVVAVMGFVFDIFVVVQSLLVALTLFLTLGLFLSDASVYKKITDETLKQEKGFRMWIPFIPHKRRMVEIFIDILIITFSYVFAFSLRFDWNIPEFDMAMLHKTLPVILPVKLIVLLASGMYSGYWKYIDFEEGKRVFGSVFLSTVATVAVLAIWFRLAGMSRAVLVIDWFVFALLAFAVRVGLRALREAFYTFQTGGRATIVIGAGDGGRLVLSEIRKDQDLDLKPVGLIDDDRWKWGRKVMGIKVLGGKNQIAVARKKFGVEEAILAIPSLSQDKRDQFVFSCQQNGMKVRVLQSVTHLAYAPEIPDPLGSSHSDNNGPQDPGAPDALH